MDSVGLTGDDICDIIGDACIPMYGYEELDKSCTYSSITYDTEVMCQGLNGFRGVAGRHSFITFAQGNTVKVLNTESGDCFPLVGHKSTVLQTAATGDGRLISAAVDGSINIWNPFEVAPNQWLNYLSDSRNNITSMSICCDDEGHIVATTKDGYICCWRMNTFMHLATIPVDLKGLFSCATSTSNRISVIGGFGRIHVYDSSITTLSHITTLGGHAGPVTAINICDLANGCIVSGGEDKSITVHQLDTFSMLYCKKNAHASAISCLAVCKDIGSGFDGRQLPELLLVSGSRDAIIRVWKLQLQQLNLMCQLQGHNGPIVSLYVAPELKIFGNRVALLSSGVDKKLRMWRLYRILNWNRRQAFIMCLANYGFIITQTYGVSAQSVPDSVAEMNTTTLNKNLVFRNKRVLRVIASYI